MKKISLIIPVYNGEKYIRRCLDSAINQSYENYEVIVVNDGSTDRTYELSKEYQKQCQFLRIIQHHKNQGLVCSWQKGVCVAKGDYIAFLDSDDWVDRQYLEKLAIGISEDADLVCCNHNRVYTNRIELFTEYIKPGEYVREEVHKYIFPILLNNGHYLSRGISPNRWGKLFRKKLLLDNMQFSNKLISYGEDLNILFPSILDCKKLIILSDSIGLYYYRQNEDSIIHTYKDSMFQQITLLRNQLFYIMNEKAIYDFTKQLNCDFWCLFLEYVKNEAKAENLIQSSREVLKNYKECKTNIPYHRLTLNFMNQLLWLCLQQNRPELTYIWMKLYAFARRIK